MPIASRRAYRFLVPALLAVLPFAHPVAVADEPSAFYAGKQVSLIIATPPGGGYDTYARVVARHIGRHIPGRPGVVPQNMPGAGGIKATSYLYNVAPKDGLSLGAVHPSAIMEPLMGAKKPQYDSSRFNYIGSANSETSLCILRTDAAVKSFKDALERQAVLGTASRGGSTGAFAATYNRILGAKFKLVSGYRGTHEISLAMERGEVQGFCGQFWSSLMTQTPNWQKEGKIRVIAQEGLKGRPELDKLGVPLVYSFASTDEARGILRLMYAPLMFGRPYIMPPEVPETRVQAMREAFAAAMKDGALLADAAKARLEINPVGGAEVRDLVASLYAMPASVVKRAQDARLH